LDQWPEPRSTNDLDLFLRPELLIDSSRLKPIASAITSLGYQVVPGAENYQFFKPGPGGTDAGSFKIDILTGPQSCFQGTHVKADTRRARPKPSVGIHLENSCLSCRSCFPPGLNLFHRQAERWALSQNTFEI
jgi:hypothetical protein